MTRAEEVVAPLECPYVGLDYYREEFGAWFFGREADGSKIITNMQAARLTLLHAESGVGKSSLLRAGVAWRLRRLLLKESSSGVGVDIPVVFSSWKDDPVLGLVRAICTAIEPFLAGRPKPVLPAGRLDVAIETAVDAVKKPLLVILDQFEEYFLYRFHEPTPERFADQLACCINRADLPANFLIAIREDAYASLGDLFKGRIANVYGNYLHIDYLDRESAEEAIRAPLDVYNGLPGVDKRIMIQDGLVGAVLDQVRVHDPASVAVQGRAATMNGADRFATPLLQLVMETVWKRERAEGSRELRLSTLQKLEGVNKIVDTHLGNELRALSKNEREMAIDMFDHLVTPSGGKIAESVSDLAHRTGHTEEQISGVLEKLDQARIVRPVPAPPGQDRSQDPLRFRRYEIFHDVLAPAINHTLAAREEQRRARRLRRLATLALGLLILAVAVGGAFAYLLHRANIAAHNADRQRNIAVSRQVAAQSETLAEREPFIGSLLAVAASRIAQTPEAGASLLNALAQPDRGVLIARQGYGPLHSVVFSPGGRTLATAGPGGTARLWNVQDHRLIYTFCIDRRVIRSAVCISRTTVNSVAFSPDGTILAIAAADGKIRLMNTATHRYLGRPLTAGTGGVTGVAFSPDGKSLATAGPGGTVRLWDVATHDHIGGPLTTGPARVTDMAFSPDDRTLAATGADGSVRLWGFPGRHRIRAFKASHTGAVYSVAFSRDGTVLVTADADGTAQLWDRATGRQKGAPLRVSASAVYSVAFSPDGKTLATAGADGRTRLWDVATRQQVIGAPLTVGAIPVNSVAFRPGGTMLATAGVDGAVRLWDPTIYRQITLSRHASQIPASSVAFSRVGTIFATGGADGIVRLWDMRTHRRIGGFSLSRTGPVNSVAFSRDGTMLAAAGVDGTVRLWDIATRREKGGPLRVGAGGVRSVAFSPDGTMLAAAGVDGTVRLWDIATRREKGGPLRVGAGGVRSVAFSPDGTMLATAGADGKAQLWDVAKEQQKGAPFTGNLRFESVAFGPRGKILATAGDDGTVRLWNDTILKRFAAHRSIGTPLIGGARMYSVAFDPRGGTLATVAGDGKARLWDVASHQQIGAPLPAGHGPVTDVAFSPDGTMLVTTSRDGGTRLWNISLPRDLVRQVCSIAHESLDLRTWQTYIPGDEPFRQVCPRG